LHCYAAPAEDVTQGQPTIAPNLSSALKGAKDLCGAPTPTATTEKIADLDEDVEESFVDWNITRDSIRLII